MREASFLGLSSSGFHRVFYVEWGAPEAPRTVVCAHGLTRNGRDFDALAGALAENCRVACPDIVGRGRSDWLVEPSGYVYAQYLAEMAALIARLAVDQVDWIGTSMGGLIGMMLAAQDRSPVRRLVMNDIGPFIAKEALERIAGYAGDDPTFADVERAEAYFREVHAPFGELSDDQWRHLTEHSIRPRDGGYCLRRDPQIIWSWRQGPIEDVDLWAVWDRLTCPVLVLRGEHSDLLPHETAEEMRRRRPQAEVLQIAGCGHAPALLDEGQIGMVREWLLRD
jgi:pimeloyl-ACP methyl ester carboxylesterase